MISTGWHAANDVLTTFATDPRSLDDTTAASVETHLAGCAACRAVAAAATDASLAASWDAIADAIDRPRRSLVERVLGAVLSPHASRIVAATPTLQAAWLAGVLVVSAASVAAARNVDSDAMFLVLAPLFPLAGVALVFAPTADPAGEVAMATPAYGAGMVVARTLSVVATTMPILLAASAFLPVVDARAVAWLLPALALTAAATALSTWWAPLTAAACAAIVWTGGVMTVSSLNGAPFTVTRSAVFGARSQVLYAAVLLVAAAVGTIRRGRFTMLEAR